MIDGKQKESIVLEKNNSLFFTPSREFVSARAHGAPPRMKKRGKIVALYVLRNNLIYILVIEYITVRRMIKYT